MYSDAIINELVLRIGFGNGEKITISTANKTGTSGRLFSYFHQLATVDNIYSTTEKIAIVEADFNTYLEQLKIDGVKSILTAIFDRNKLYLSDFDYSGIISERIQLFDDAIGYAVAIAIIEQMVSSPRMNTEERNIEMTYQQLKIELEGARNEHNHVIALGVKAELISVIQNIKLVLFPNPASVSSKPVW